MTFLLWLIVVFGLAFCVAFLAVAGWCLHLGGIETQRRLSPFYKGRFFARKES